MYECMYKICDIPYVYAVHLVVILIWQLANLALIAKLNDANTTVLIITHVMNNVLILSRLPN